MSYSTFSASARKTVGWPIYDNQRSQNIQKTPSTIPKPNLSRSSTMTTTRSTPMHSTDNLALVPVHPAGGYSFWSPPDRPGSPDDEQWAIPHDEYSTSTSSNNSSDDESPKALALALVPKTVPVKFSPVKKSIGGELIGSKHAVSNLSGIFGPMSAEQGGMQLLAVRSPSVHYDKQIHGYSSPVQTIHLLTPRSVSANGRSKPKLPLPLPSSGKTRPRGAHTPALQRPMTAESVTSPPVVGLDLALMPPSDHRDSAMSPRSSMAVKTPAKLRPTTLMPIDIPKRRSTSSGPTIWKPVSAPTPSPLSSRPPDQPALLAPQSNIISHTSRLDTLQPNRNASSSSVSINRPSPTPIVSSSTSALQNPSSASIVNERAEILRRTLSSNNIARASRADASLSARPAEDSPHSSVSSHITIEKALPAAPSPERSPLASQPPAPTPAQSTIQFPTNSDDAEPEAEFEPEYLETPPLLRVVNVTEEDFVVSPTSPPPPAPAPMPPAPTIEVVPSTPQQPHMELAALAASIARELTPVATAAPVPVIAAPEPSPKRGPTPLPLKHTSLPVPSRPSSHVHRASLSDGPAPPSRGSYVPSERFTPRLAPLPASRQWLPRKPVMPTPLQPTASLPNVHSQALPTRQSLQQTSQTQSFAGRSQQPHVPGVLETPPTHRNSYRPLAPPAPRFAQPDYYSSDEDDPSKWASVPEIPSSRRSSRSSRSIPRNSIYQSHADTDDEDGMVYPPPPSISLPNLRSILQSNDIEAPVTRDGSGAKKIQFAVPNDGAEKPSQAAGGRRRIRRRSNSTDSVVRNSREIPWGSNPTPRHSGLVTIPDPYGVDYADEGRYDAINHPELIPSDISQRYIRSDGAPKFPEYHEMYSAKEKALRAAAEREQRERILGKRTRTPATSVEFDEAPPAISIPVVLRRPRAISEGGSKLRRRSRSRDRADWGPTPTIPDPEVNVYRPINMSPPSNSLIPSALERVGRKFSLFRR